MTNNMAVGSAILTWISQGVGAFVGYLIAGLLGESVAAHNIAGFNFFEVAVTGEFWGEKFWDAKINQKWDFGHSKS